VWSPDRTEELTSNRLKFTLDPFTVTDATDGHELASMVWESGPLQRWPNGKIGPKFVTSNPVFTFSYTNISNSPNNHYWISDYF
jgi:hypothetical protein